MVIEYTPSRIGHSIALRARAHSDMIPYPIYNEARYTVLYAHASTVRMYAQATTSHTPFTHPWHRRPSLPTPSHTTPPSSWRSSSAVSTTIGYSPGKSDKKRGESEEHGRVTTPYCLAAYLHTRSSSIQQTDAQTLLLLSTIIVDIPGYWWTLVDPGQTDQNHPNRNIIGPYLSDISCFCLTPDSWTGPLNRLWIPTATHCHQSRVKCQEREMTAPTPRPFPPEVFFSPLILPTTPYSLPFSFPALRLAPQFSPFPVLPQSPMHLPLSDPSHPHILRTSTVVVLQYYGIVLLLIPLLAFFRLHSSSLLLLPFRPLTALPQLTMRRSPPLSSSFLASFPLSRLLVQIRPGWCLASILGASLSYS